jgi:hypothetical protein
VDHRVVRGGSGGDSGVGYRVGGARVLREILAERRVFFLTGVINLDSP